jgi:hypothetical protein
VQGELFIADNHGVTSVIAALIANYVINSVAEQVGGFTLALIAPLGSN